MDFEWKQSLPESLGMKSDKLAKLWSFMEERNTSVLLIARDDNIVWEKYSEGSNANTLHGTASSAKAMVGGLSLMVAVCEGLLNIDDPACKYIPQWQNDPLKSKITIRQLAAHTSGLDDAHEEGMEHQDLPGWKGAFWRQEPDPFLISRDEAPVVFAPGTDYLYSNPGIAMMDYAVAASLKGTQHEDTRTLLRERIFKPIGIHEEEWSIGYEKTFNQDGLKLIASWGGGKFTARAMARLARLILNRGMWEGTQLIDPKVVNQALTHSGTPSYHSFGFWVNSDLAGNKRWPSLPWDTVMALGAKDKIVLIIPSRNLILIRNGGGLGLDPTAGINKLERFIGEPLMAALEELIPYPKSEKISKLEWAPACTIVRMSTGETKRDGSDNWPITWADDDNLYTAYGDGYGFEPSLPHKLGMGFGRISGNPDRFTCENIRSNGENTGYGGRGEKASGLLMADRVLYLWVRNSNLNGEHARLGRSNDYAKTWDWCDWRFEEFGHIAFVNYGRNYEDARDEYVYMVSHDHPSAYQFADRFVLMRAPKNRLSDRSSYEFYKETDGRNQPLWTADVNGRGAVFTNPHSCLRSSISYNAGIGRYLWWQQYPSVKGYKEDTRYTGGLGVYEAPEPWGPWKTVYFADKWDVGPGDLGCFPTKWMSEDGKTIYLVFAGNDNFSLRKATLTVTD